MSEMGLALMGSGVARGDSRAVEAARRAISSPLLEDISIHGAKGVLINITGASDMTLHEVNEASMLIQEEAHEDAHIIFGSVIDEKMGEEIRVTVIATGFGKDDSKRVSSVKNIAQAVIVGDLDIPTIVRKEKEKKHEVGTAEVQRLKPLGGFNAVDEDAYDTPTFLRKQAD
jgi:cell division protein FtsZ